MSWNPNAIVGRNRRWGAKGYTTIRLAALKDGLYIEKARKSRFLGQTAPFGMTMFRLIGY
jgi:hypothetical protein